MDPKIAEQYSQKLFWAIQGLFSLVVGKSFLDYSEFFIPPPLRTDGILPILAWLTVYIFVLWSWVDLSYSSIMYPYHLEDKRERRRMFIDFLIVLLYVYLLACLGYIKKIENAGNSISFFFVPFSLIFGAYFISGRLRMGFHGRQASNKNLILIFLVLFILHNVFYYFIFKESTNGVGTNKGFIVAALTLTILYRSVRLFKMSTIKKLKNPT